LSKSLWLLAVQLLEVTVEILVWSNHQQLECALIKDSVGQQTKQALHAEFVDTHPSEVADFGCARFRLIGDGSHRFVERGFLLLVQLFDGALERGCDKNTH